MTEKYGISISVRKRTATVTELEEGNFFVVFQMYSFVYDESETWAVWPNDMDLLAFNDGSSDIVIQQIMRQLFDGVRKQIDELKDKVQKEKSLVTIKVNELLTAFEDYRSHVQINEVFVRYSLATYSILRDVTF